MIGWIIGIGLGVATALYASVSSEPAQGGGGLQLPFVPGPGGYGMAYGDQTQTFPVPGEVWRSNRAIVAADGSWAVEGEYFLPTTGPSAYGASVPMSPSLAEALERRIETDGLWGSTDANAWGYVRHLRAQGMTDSMAIARKVANQAGRLWAGNAMGIPDATAYLEDHRNSITPALQRWLDSLSARIAQAPSVGISLEGQSATRPGVFQAQPATRQARFSW